MTARRQTDHVGPPGLCIVDDLIGGRVQEQFDRPAILPERLGSERQAKGMRLGGKGREKRGCAAPVDGGDHIRLGQGVPQPQQVAHNQGHIGKGNLVGLPALAGRTRHAGQQRVGDLDIGFAPGAKTQQQPFGHVISVLEQQRREGPHEVDGKAGLAALEPEIRRFQTCRDLDGQGVDMKSERGPWLGVDLPDLGGPHRASRSDRRRCQLIFCKNLGVVVWHAISFATFSGGNFDKDQLLQIRGGKEHPIRAGARGRGKPLLFRSTHREA